jgi:rRNA biogenesis protein RRP5
MGKRKNDSEGATEKVNLSTEEVDFPRGGASVLTPLEHREISNKVAKDLFSTKVYKSS